MSRFSNTKLNNTVNTLVEGYQNKLNNTFNTHTDKHPTIVTYYNQNTLKSTLDEGSKGHYSAIGKDSPLRFNKIFNFYLYGIEKFTLELENGDYGLESNGVDGEAICLPNTIVPIPNDYFIINHIKHSLLFKIIDVSINTLENGSNFYKLVFKLDKTELTAIDTQVTDEFEMVVNNIGTQFNSIIRSSDYNYITKVEGIIDKMKIYYTDIYFNDRVQTFIFKYKGDRFYDPHLIEFIKRTNLFSGMDKYIHVEHQTYIPKTFSLNYDKTMFRLIEYPESKNREPRVDAQAIMVEEYLSILSTRVENYYQIHYLSNNNYNQFSEILHTFDKEFMNNILNNITNEIPHYSDIIVKYINNSEITKVDINTINDIDYDDNITLFYNIPLIIYILEKNIKDKIITNK